MKRAISHRRLSRLRHPIFSSGLRTPSLLYTRPRMWVHSVLPNERSSCKEDAAVAVQYSVDEKTLRREDQQVRTNVRRRKTAWGTYTSAACSPYSRHFSSRCNAAT
ncbi:hypothetical protein ACS0PU_003107 [Formica fusca]